MRLIERLEKRARELDQEVRAGTYNYKAADDRELLLEAVCALKEAGRFVVYAMKLCKVVMEKASD